MGCAGASHGGRTGPARKFGTLRFGDLVLLLGGARVLGKARFWGNVPLLGRVVGAMTAKLFTIWGRFPF